MKQSRDYGASSVINLRLISYRLMTLVNGRLWLTYLMHGWIERRAAAAAAQVCTGWMHSSLLPGWPGLQSFHRLSRDISTRHVTTWILYSDDWANSILPPTFVHWCVSRCRYHLRAWALSACLYYVSRIYKWIMITCPLKTHYHCNGASICLWIDISGT